MQFVYFLQHLLLPHQSNNQRAKILHPTALVLVIAIFLTFQYLLTQASNAFPQILGFASQIPADEIIRLTNVQRQSNGLPVLKLDSQLSAAASRKAADMFARNYWAHVSPIGTQPWYFITQEGYPYRYAGENLARDFSDPNSVVKAWIASPSHKENLMSNRYQDIGVAVVDGSLDGHETTLVVQMFGTRLSAASSPSVGRTASLTVSASELAQVPTPVPTMAVASTSDIQTTVTISPFTLSKYFTFSLLGLFTLVLALDIIIVNRKSLIRWTGKSFAHLVFVMVVLVAATTVIGGKIL